LLSGLSQPAKQDDPSARRSKKIRALGRHFPNKQTKQKQISGRHVNNKQTNKQNNSE